MDPFVAEIRIFPFNFAPRGWAFCNGQILPISQNAALYSLLGATYGGDGRSTFQLPNLQGGVPVQPGQGPGLSQYVLGQTGGTQTVGLSGSQMPSHTHDLLANNNNPTTATPSPSETLSRANAVVYKSSTTTVSLSQSALGTTGKSVPHNNMMPYLSVNFCIAMIGVFPQRP